MWFFYDYWYIVLVMPAVLFSIFASIKVNTTFKKYSKVRSSRGITGAEAARRVLDANGLYSVKIERVRGDLTDHYDPRNNTIYLSETVYDNPSAAAIGVASHEAGHAVQHAVGYVPIKIRAAIIPATRFGSMLAFPLILLGLFLEASGMIYLAYLGVACFGLSTLFQLVTLPTEFNASRRALESIESCGILARDEISSARKVLSAAAMTYVAALAVSLMQLLRLLLIVAGNSRKD
ncbi:MAG: zinc metallopeptidase [Clostridia bacterium]|nr:zinc metallopeptidase [Clostridia bacterium]